MENALIKFENAPLTKAKQLSLAEQTIEAALSGNNDPVEIEIILKAMEETITLIRKDERFKSALYSELSKYGKEAFQKNGVKVAIRKGRTFYDYSYCNDSVWDGLKDKQDDLKEKIKTRENFLKSIDTTETLPVNPETGEEIHAPNQTGGGESHAISFPKE